MNKRFEALDAFRGLAAISVVLFHMHVVDSITELDFSKGSSLFVNLFFVLSGFVLAHGYGTKKNLVFLVFMKGRFFRLYPLHLIMLLVFLLLEAGKLIVYKYGDFSFNHVPFTGSTAVSEVLPNLLLVQSWSSLSDELSFNYPSWSISIEFYLYFLLFLSVVLFKNLKSIVWFFIALAAIYLTAVESEILVGPVLKGLSCFFGGAVMYMCYQKIAHIRVNKLCGSIVEVSTIACVVLVVQSEFIYRNIVAIVLFYIVILAFSLEAGVLSSLLKLRPFQVLGKLSYSIYMTHAAILLCFTSFMMILQKYTGIELTQMLNQTRYLSLGNVMANNLMVLTILAIIIFISGFTYRYIELRWKRKG